MMMGYGLKIFLQIVLCVFVGLGLSIAVLVGIPFIQSNLKKKDDGKAYISPIVGVGIFVGGIAAAVISGLILAYNPQILHAVSNYQAAKAKAAAESEQVKEALSDNEQAIAILKEGGESVAQVGADALQRNLVADAIQQGVNALKTVSEKALGTPYESEEGELPAVNIAEAEYEKYEKYRGYAGLSTRNAMNEYKIFLCELYGVDCTDAVSIPIWMEMSFFEQLLGYEEITDPYLKGVDFSNKKAVREAIRKREAEDRAAWNKLSTEEKQDIALERDVYDVVNDPVICIGRIELWNQDELMTKNNKELFADMMELIEEAYSKERLEKEGYDGKYGVNYFLEYKDQEAVRKHRESTTDEFYRRLAVPTLEIMSHFKATGFAAPLSERNMCRPIVPLDPACRLVLADYQESRTALILERYDKNGKLVVRYGINVLDRRPEKLTIPTAKKATPPAKTTPKKKVTQKKSVPKVETASTPTPEPTPEPTPTPPGDDDDDDDPPPPTPNPEKDPDDDPSQNDNADDSGGNNDGKEDGGDQNQDDANKEEDQDNKDNNPGNNDSTPPADNNPPSDEGNHDTGGDASQVEDSGGQNVKVEEDHDNGDGTSTSTEKDGNTGGNKNTGTVEDE